MKTEIIKDYRYKHPLATITTEVTVKISPKGRRMLSASEVKRLGRLVALEYFKKNYKSALSKDLSIDADILRALMAIMNLGQSELSHLIACSESKVSRALTDNDNYQALGDAHIVLLMERLGMDLVRPGAAKSLANKEILSNECVDLQLAEVVNSVRYAS